MFDDSTNSDTTEGPIEQIFTWPTFSDWCKCGIVRVTLIFALETFTSSVNLHVSFGNKSIRYLLNHTNYELSGQ